MTAEIVYRQFKPGTGQPVVANYSTHSDSGVVTLSVSGRGKNPFRGGVPFGGVGYENLVPESFQLSSRRPGYSRHFRSPHKGKCRLI
jgi:hypothetical protein